MIMRLLYLCLIAVVTFRTMGPAQADRLKDLTSIAGVRSNQLVGYGLVVGLARHGRRQCGYIDPAVYAGPDQPAWCCDTVPPILDLNGKNVSRCHCYRRIASRFFQTRPAY